MSRVDLHIHTKFSDDGEFSPEEIIRQCEACGMEWIAVTDHNCVRGVAEALKAAVKVRVIQGVELDCVYRGQNFHLLGYGIDVNREEFAAVEQDILQQERRAAEEKIRLFRQAAGIVVDADEILAGADNGVVTGEQIAEHVLKRGDADRYEILAPYLPGGEKSDMPNVRFYWDFFAKGKPAYVEISYLSLPDAAALIHSAGGAAVLAHPGQNLGGDDELLDQITEEMIDGIEVFSSYHSREQALHYLEAAEQKGLFVTCGSDFHGKNKPNIVLGGHNALWSDERLTSELKKCSLWKLPVL